VGTMGKVISLAGTVLGQSLPRSFNRLRRLALLTPSCGGPLSKWSADLEEKRVTCGAA
jgi:hypothetical protein